MPLRLFTLGNSIIACLLTTSPLTLFAQTPTLKPGYVRFWDMLPASRGSFELRDTNTKSQTTISTATAFQYSGYHQLPPAKYRLGVFRPGETASSLRLVDIDLKADTFYTIIVGPNAVEVSEDTEDLKTAGGTLTIRNFFPNTSVSGSVFSKPLFSNINYGTNSRIDGLSPDRFPVVLRTQLPNGVTSESTAEIDFKTCRRATLLIIPDAYGRFRPRVAIDGKN